MVLDTIEPDETVREPNRSTLYVWGCNLQGQTGHDRGLSGDPRSWRCQRTPQPLNKFGQQTIIDSVGNALRLVDIACGLQHTAAVTANGELYTWGSNDYGQLGDGSENDCREPKRVDVLKKESVISVACGAHSSAAISQRKVRDRNLKAGEKGGAGGPPASGGGGRLWLWGRGSVSNYPRLFWGAFTPKTVIKHVACGMTHAAAVSVDGDLQTWGYNEFGQLGHGFTSQGQQEARIVRGFAKFLDEPPMVVRIVAVACGQYHTAAITDNGDVYSWGRGDMGQLGHRTLQLSNREVVPRRVVALEGVKFTQIACGQIHTCGITAKGALYMWGGGKDGQLGLGARKELCPSASGGYDNFSMRRLPTLVMMRGARMVACGQSHTLVSTSDGRLLGWGYNSCGQAATGKEAYAWLPSPIDWCVGEIYKLAAGGGHSAVLTQACTLKELCEFRLADTVTLDTAPVIEDIAARSGGDSLMRFCEKFRQRALEGTDEDMDEDEDQRRRSRNKQRHGDTYSVAIGV